MLSVCLVKKAPAMRLITPDSQQIVKLMILRCAAKRTGPETP